jgi:teichuronic acid exporter
LTADATKLDRSLVTGIAWTAAARWLGQLISWGATLYAARILKPSDYGLVAMAMLPIGLARMAEDFGLDAVLVQDQSLDPERLSRLAGFALLVGATCTLVFVSLARPVAIFFNEPPVALAICGLSVLFVLDALQIVPRAMLQRALQFRRLAILALVQVVFTSAALVIAAANALGHWSLIVNSLAGALAATLLLIWWHPYRVAWPRRIASITGPIQQGWRVLVSRASWYAYTTADQTVIGKMLGKDALGAYSFATTFANLPMQELTAIVSRVVPGVFVQLQQERSQLRRYFLVLTEFLSCLAFPVAAGIALTADLIVQIALGPQWNAVVAPLRILCLYAAIFAAQTLLAHLLMWTGQFRAQMWCSVLAAVLLPIAFLVGSRAGLAGVAWAWSIAFPLVNIPAFVLGFRTINIGVLDFLRVLTAPLVACTAMAVAVTTLAAELSPSLGPIRTLACLALTGASVYAAVMWFGFRSQVNEILATIRAVRSQPSVPALRPE